MFYGLFVGVFIYRTLTFRILYDILRETVAGTSVVMIVVTCAGLYSWLGATVGLIDKIAALLLGISENPLVILLMINIILLFAGMLLRRDLHRLRLPADSGARYCHVRLGSHLVRRDDDHQTWRSVR